MYDFFTEEFVERLRAAIKAQETWETSIKSPDSLQVEVDKYARERNDSMLELKKAFKYLMQDV